MTIGWGPLEIWQSGRNHEKTRISDRRILGVRPPGGQTYFQFSSSGLSLTFIACSQPERSRSPTALEESGLRRFPFGNTEHHHRLLASREISPRTRAILTILSLTSADYRCQEATSSRRAKSVQAICRKGEGNRRKHHTASRLVDFGTRVQFPPPPFFLCYNSFDYNCLRLPRTRVSNPPP